MATPAKNKRVTITGRSAIVKKLNAVVAAMSAEEQQAARTTIMDVLGDGADLMAGAMRTMARINQYPQEVIQSIFSSRKLPPSIKIRKKPSALAGVAKGETIREWRATSNPRSSRAKVGVGGKVAMSLATMFEFGTSKMPARHAITTAVLDSKSAVAVTIKDGLNRMIGEAVK
jgi:hypothetical protein